MNSSRFRRLLATALAAVGLTLPLGQEALAEASPGICSYTLPSDAAYPESITQKPGTTTFYVSAYSNGGVYRGVVGRQALTAFISGDSAHTVATGVKDDGHGHLFVLRGKQQLIDVYDDTTGALVGELSTASFGSGGLLNDLAFAPDGTAYVTDSTLPYLFRIGRNDSGGYAVDKWLDFTGTAMTYSTGGEGPAALNANGVAATPDGKYLLVGQTNKSALFRIDIASHAVSTVDTSGVNLGYPDGINLVDGTAYVAGNAANTVSELTFNSDYSSATSARQLDNPVLSDPSAALPVNGRLLVTELQGNVTTPTVPFTVTSLPLS